MKYLLFTCLAAVLLAACGYKGDLYLPDGKTRHSVQEQQS